MTRLERFSEGRAFVPFLMVGDPDLETSAELLEVAVRSGADGLELGIPFSDPVADGKTIQAAARRALQSGVTPPACFELLKDFRARHPDTPVGLLVYANLVLARGVDAFYARAADVGVDGVLVADVPTREGAPFSDAARAHGVDPVFIAAPNSPDSVLQRIGELGRGFTYVVARRGVTGVRSEATLPEARLFESLERLRAPPPVIGFGISEPAHVAAALALGAKGAISGSAVIQRIEAHLADRRGSVQAVGQFIETMKAATVEC